MLKIKEHHQQLWGCDNDGKRAVFHVVRHEIEVREAPVWPEKSN